MKELRYQPATRHQLGLMIPGCPLVWVVVWSIGILADRDPQRYVSLVSLVTPLPQLFRSSYEVCRAFMHGTVASCMHT